MAYYFLYDVKLRLLADSRSFLANQKARNAIVGAENLLILDVYFSQGKFKSVPTVLVSAEHERRGVKHDASSLWVEDLTTTSFKICIRELQNFDGAHQSIHVVSSFQLFVIANSSCTVQFSIEYIFRWVKV